ncbi:PREDICTED: protein NRT1/ PTR FAMILY 5.2-like [Ipomoea nil]|uniref:protein NRT1/ PTR FAMILY 5.2-like n=1 Tax=Ipomoea nil TaxID=35883 RepID=UPI000901E827|nr:PREDICTED: protein NRT1/ PTR FAMILY 5.2-like [Ipomoea nil]
MAGAEEKGFYDDGYTQDGTVSLKGKPVLRSKTGGWKACSFIVVYEVFERMCYWGISSNLVLYMTTVLHQGTVESSNNVTNWVGTVFLTPILGAYVADAFLGRFWTFIIASAIYFLGMALLTLAVSVPALKPPPCANANGAHCPEASTLQLSVFFGALYILAVGNGGTKPNIPTIAADQFDVHDPKEKSQKLSFFNWWLFSVFLGTFFANTIVVYIQDNVGWAVGYGLPTVGLAVSLVIFSSGTPFYRHKKALGISPITKMARVIVAAFKKWNVPIPSDLNDFYELHPDVYIKKGQYMIKSTPSLRFLNKACVQTGATTPWMLCPVSQVEETKQMLRLVPILISTFIPSILFAQINTLFVKQGVTLDRKIGNFNFPPASVVGMVTFSMLFCIVIYDRAFVPAVRKWTQNPRGLTLLQRLGIGFVLNIVVVIVAGFTEMHRLAVAKEHGLVESGGQVPLTIFTLLPQLFLLGLADAFVEVAKTEFFYDQAPESMKSLGSSCFPTSLGVGNFLSSFVLSTVSRVTERGGRKGWILNNLNDSRLDYYYWFIALLNVVNLGFFFVVAKYYEYKAEISDFSEGTVELNQNGSAANGDTDHEASRKY